jgi:hypothetical protein
MLAAAIALLCLIPSVLQGQALESQEWVDFPASRRLHASCIHKDEAAPALLPPCQHVHPFSDFAAHPRGNGYYGGWSVYSVVAAKRPLSHMSATFTVPPKPTSLGPLGLSSLYMYVLHQHFTCRCNSMLSKRSACFTRAQISWARRQQSILHPAAGAAGGSSAAISPDPRCTTAALNLCLIFARVLCRRSVVLAASSTPSPSITGISPVTTSTLQAEQSVDRH